MKEGIKIKLVDIMKNPRVIFLVFLLICSYFMVFGFNLPFNNKGVVINGIAMGSFAENAHMTFDSGLNPVSYEQITYVNNDQIETLNDYYNAISKLSGHQSVIIRTNKKPSGYSLNINLSENDTISESLGISVEEKHSSNIKLGIDLEGGSRLILRPTDEITDSEFDLLLTSIKNRLDIYGASGTKVSELNDQYTKEKFVIIESSSSKKNEIYDLVKRQGIFEAKIGNQTVFTGEDVYKVFNDPQHAGLQGCSQNTEGHICSYRFTVEINSKAADNMLNIASSLSEKSDGYLSEKLCFYLDSKEITCLNVASSFKYEKVTTPSITVSGRTMDTEKQAIDSGNREMKFLQTILSTKSLPSRLEIVQSYSISTNIGEKLLDNALFVGIMALFFVSMIVALRYRHPGIFVSIFIALIGEVIIILGVAGMLNKMITIDLAAIGGLIAAIGTGVDDQIIITDEYFKKNKTEVKSKKKIKNAFYVIMVAYFTTVAAMVPLMFAGLKMLQGFCFMILLGITIGVLITRPAYAAMLRIIMTTRKEREEENSEEE